MKANELMIGDWVFCKYPSINKPVRVAEIKTVYDNKLKIVIYDDDVPLVFNENYIDPISLTPEILEKNFRGYKLGSGALAYFVYELNDDYFIRASAGGIYLCVHYDDSEHAAHDDIYLEELKYVHTLQLALMLFGFDKEIVL